MFCSNQIFDVACTAKDLPRVLAFGLSMADDVGDCLTREDGRIRLAFSQPAPDVYAIGYGSMKPFKTGPNKGWFRNLPEGWTDYPFDYDPAIVGPIVAQWLDQNPPDPADRPDIDGAVEPGLRIRCPQDMLKAMPGLREIPHWNSSGTLLYLTPCWLEYHK